MIVQELMTKEVITLSADQSLGDAVSAFQRHRIRHVPVTNGRHVVGIVTDRDVKRATPSLLSGIDQDEYNRVLEETKIYQVMTRDPFCVAPSTTLKEALQVMIDKKYGGLPVVEEGEIVGIITQIDLLRAFLDTLK